MSEYAVVGKGVPRIDGMTKATGESVYAADLWRPGCLCGCILRSPYPHARIRHMDTARAESVQGVRGVFTARNSPNGPYGLWILDETLFAVEKVRYVGDEVAAVAATDEDAAREALELIEVDYEELPAVFDPEEALQPDAPLVHEDFAQHQVNFEIEGREGNRVCRLGYDYGDPEAGWALADEVIENRFRTHAHHPTYLETHGALAEVDSGGNVTVHLTTQSVYVSQELIAAILGIPLSKVRVVGTTVGGGFGGKKPRIEHYAAVMAYELRKPVRIVLSREEDLACTFRRHPSAAHVRSGVQRDGTVTAWDLGMVMDTGAYTDHGPSIAGLCAFHCRGPYRIPNVKIDVSVVYTNQSISGAFRGYGNPQAAFAVECQMDAIARKLDMDPIELRQRNAMGPGDPMINGQCYPDVRLRETLEQAASAFGWEPAGPGSKPSRRGGRKRGIGVACGSQPTGGMGSSAVIKMMADGTIQVLTGIIEIGAGEYTVAAQIAAETLGIPYEKVRVIGADTDKTPFDFYTAASRATLNLGNSVRRAAEDVRSELLQRAAEMIEASPDDLRMESERVFISGAPERSLSYADVARAANLFRDGPIVGKGSYAVDVPPILPGFRQEGAPPEDFATHAYATHIAEVEVDEETGEVEVLRLVCSHDIGQAINRSGLEGQIEGGITQGFGYALVEEMVFEGGVLANGTMVDYKIPNILDAPPLEYHFIEEGDPAGPYGAKGVGEAVLVPTAPAIANAVYDAIGARVTGLPLTAEKVLRAVDEGR